MENKKPNSNREIKFRAWDREAKRFTNYQIGIFDDSVRFYDKARGTWHNAGERLEVENGN